jgi:hypothetical protein
MFISVLPKKRLRRAASQRRARAGERSLPFCGWHPVSDTNPALILGVLASVSISLLAKLSSDRN